MTKKQTSLIIVFCAVLLALAGVILVRYYHRVIDHYTMAETGEDLIPIAGYTYTTTDEDLSSTEGPDGSTIKRTFTHAVFAPDGSKLTTVTVTVSGNISNDSSSISHISTSLSEEQSNVLTISEHLSRETATVVLYVNQISVCHFQYRLSPEGSIDPVK